MSTLSKRQATLFRMATDTHTCPFGLKAKSFLQRQGYAVDDHPLATREATDKFKIEHGVKTTPQVFIEGERIGGYEDLLRHFGRPTASAKTRSYQPVITVFVIAALMALASSFRVPEHATVMWGVQRFIAFSMCVLALLKLQNIEAFANTFLGYDLLARRWVPYAYIYPYAEAVAGLLMLAGVLAWVSVPAALFIGGLGSVSVYKAVYIEKRDLKCACVGGDSNVPLGAVSLLENVMMVAMALWMVFGISAL